MDAFGGAGILDGEIRGSDEKETPSVLDLEGALTERKLCLTISPTNI